jgi:flavodoxin
MDRNDLSRIVITASWGRIITDKEVMKRMKKAISLVFVILLTFSLFGCGGTSAQAAPAASAANEPTSPTAPPAPTPNDQSQTAAHSNVLVLYFSATGTTKRVAEKISAVTGGDLLEIVPAQPYTTEDLNYNDSSTRATVEQNTPDARPEIANDIDLEGYETLYLGYPIWWGQAPRIMSTFAETHEFDGITVIPFCTSGGSGAGRTGEKLGEQAGSGTWLSSTRFDGNVSEEKLQSWINGRK